MILKVIPHLILKKADLITGSPIENLLKISAEIERFHKQKNVLGKKHLF